MSQSLGLLKGVRVLELAQRVCGPYCGKILAHMGAEVIKIEPPHGDETRRRGPYPGHISHLEKSGLFLWLNANKYGVTLDLDNAEDQKHFKQLAASADIVIDSNIEGELSNRGLGYEMLHMLNPGLILASISGFGNWGPYAGYKATDLTLFHMSGNAHSLLGPVDMPEEEPPIRAGGHQADLVVGMAATTAIQAALLRKSTTGAGCQIHISAFEAMVTQLISGLANCAYGQSAPPRNNRHVKEAAIGGMVTAIGGILPCHDGYVAISPREDDQWARWLEVMDKPSWAFDERFLTRQARQKNAPALWGHLSEWSYQYSKHDIAMWGQNLRIPCFPVNTVKDLLQDNHLAARRFFVEIDHPKAGRLTYPGAPYSFSNTPLSLTERPAPLIGQHNDIYLTKTPKARLKTSNGAQSNHSQRPLEGIRVLDLSWIIAGPTATRILAMMGAEVIKLGSARRPDPSTGSAPFQAYNQSKLYAALNISTQQGLDLAKQLASKCDVVVENFAAGVIERLGLGYDDLQAVNRDVIMVSSSGTGHTGPHKDYVAYGSLLQHYTGWNSISGHPNREPIKGGLWADPWVGMELAMITLAALNHKAITGAGQYIDMSMAEALSASIGEEILSYQMNGSAPKLNGNSDEWNAPHDVYPCDGDDCWIAIAVTNNAEWQALCQVIQRPDLAADARFMTAAGRKSHDDELQTAIAAWTQCRSDYTAMHLLQAAGVPAAPSLDIARVYLDSQLRDGGYLKSLQTHDGENRMLPSLPWRYCEIEGPLITAAPVLGQHNDYVYRELLGLSQAEITRLTDEQILF